MTSFFTRGKSLAKLSHLELQQFGHELLDSLGIVLQRGAQSPPACHDGLHLSLIPAKDQVVWQQLIQLTQFNLS